MLSELTCQEWQDALCIPDDRLPQALILRGTRNLRANADKYRAFLEDPVELCPPNALFENVVLGNLRGVPVAYASVYGAAMASEITHLCGVLGARRVILTGCCGAVAPGLLPGDLVCATSARAAEGAAHCYLPYRHRVSASSELVNAVAAEAVSPVSLYRGAVWTTAALLAESEADLRAWRRQEYTAVDMETATVYAVAEYFGMQRIALLFVFDNPLDGDTLLLTGEDSRIRREAGEHAMIAAALDLAAPVGVA
ncbi:MAG: hypothetical protein RBU21_25585 [FCB group bacterium]|jgi:purine-nucleoside phosphorylase|nr:hypothetical protein [FCB group bacterium]